MCRHGVLADVRPNISRERTRYGHITPVSEFRCPLHHLQAEHVAHRAVAGNIGQPATQADIAQVLVEPLRMKVVGEFIHERVGAVTQLSLKIQTVAPWADTGQQTWPDGALEYPTRRAEHDGRACCEQLIEAWKLAGGAPSFDESIV